MHDADHESDSHANGVDDEDTDRDLDDWRDKVTADLDDEQVDELARLRAKMGFIPVGEATVRTIGGRYEILRTVGYGGMGVVYQVHDRELDSSAVALKLVRKAQLRHVANAETRLRSEARQMAKLRGHPNVVTVHDVGSHGGSTYLTMELVNGTDLRRWHDAGQPTRDQILRAYLWAARGLQAAHDIGITHRDFKPDNVLIDSEGTVKVADFGIAAVTASLPIDQSNFVNRRTAVRGTVPYMSPEQMAGERPDARSDQFSFCVALWEALTGQLPYTWRSLNSQREALSHEPALAGKVPRWLRRALLEGMSASRADRFGEMRELITVIERGMARPRRVKRASIGFAAAVVAGVAGVAIVSPRNAAPTCEGFVGQAQVHWGMSQQAKLELRRQDAPESVSWAIAQLDELTSGWRQAARDSCVGDQAPADPERRCLEGWLGALDQAVELLVVRGDRQTLLRAPELLASLKPPNDNYCAIAVRPSDPELAELVEGARGSAMLGDYENADALSAQALERGRALAGQRRYTTGLAHAHAVRGEVLYLSEDPTTASAEYRSAEAHAIGTNDLESLARIRVMWARNLALALEPELSLDASEQLDRAQPLFIAGDLPSEALLVGELIETRALIDEGLGRFDAALGGYTSAAEFFTQVGNPLLAARAIYNRGSLHHLQARLEAAESDYREALGMFRAEQVPSGYPRVLDVEFNLGLVLLDHYYELDDPELGSALADEGLVLLGEVAHQAPTRLRLTALGLACQFAADAHKIERLRSLAETTLAELAAATRVDPEVRDRVRAQVALALIIELDDPRGETLVSELLDRGDELEPSLRWELARSWIEHLEREGRCKRARAELEKLHGLGELDEFQRWNSERPIKACR